MKKKLRHRQLLDLAQGVQLGLNQKRGNKRIDRLGDVRSAGKRGIDNETSEFPLGRQVNGDGAA